MPRSRRSRSRSRSKSRRKSPKKKKSPSTSWKTKLGYYGLGFLSPLLLALGIPLATYYAATSAKRRKLAKELIELRSGLSLKQAIQSNQQNLIQYVALSTNPNSFVGKRILQSMKVQLENVPTDAELEQQIAELKGRRARGLFGF